MRNYLKQIKYVKILIVHFLMLTGMAILTYMWQAEAINFHQALLPWPIVYI